MKILSRISVALLVLLGIAFLVTQNAACSAAKAAKCQGGIPMTLGLDENNCETKQPLEVAESLMKDLLDGFDVKEECYRLRTYEDHNAGPWRGTLDELQCISKKSAAPQDLDMLQPNGNGQTQRIMFHTQLAKAAFERLSQALAKPSPSPSPSEK